MNFDEAIEFKKTFGNIFVQEEKEYKVFVTPQDEKDLNNYLSEYRNYDYTDKSALMFSNNSKFQVCGVLWERGNVFVKRLSQ